MASNEMNNNNNRDRGTNRDRNEEKNNNKSKNKNKIVIEEREDRFIIGTRIIKKFSGVPYEGKIVGYNGQWYRVKFTDDDKEDLTHYQIRIRLKNRIKMPRERRRKRQRDTLVQTNLRGQQLPSSDSEIFGHAYPTRINDNCSIITYQNT